MPSPFPGVDPFLEASGDWEDFHVGFLVYCRDWLSSELPERYSVRIHRRLTARSSREETEPDLVVDGVGHRAPVQVEPGHPVAVRFRFEEPETSPFLTITERSSGTAVTIVEILSPSDKEHPGVILYHAERESRLYRYVHLVEVDLLLTGTRAPMREPLPPGDYYAYVARAECRPRADVYAWTVRRPLPVIPIPLLDPDPEYRLDLGTLFRQAYDRGRYERSVNYAGDPPSFLRLEDRDWAREIIRQVQTKPAP